MEGKETGVEPKTSGVFMETSKAKWSLLRKHTLLKRNPTTSPTLQNIEWRAEGAEGLNEESKRGDPGILKSLLHSSVDNLLVSLCFE